MMAATEILTWHRRDAMVLAGQLPENMAETQLVLIALHELVDSYLSQSPSEEVPPRSQRPYHRSRSGLKDSARVRKVSAGGACPLLGQIPDLGVGTKN
jgi:hypothetical protein